MKTGRALALTLVMGLAALPAAAQNTELRTNYGELSLRSGFLPDPRIVNLRAGGDIAATRAGANCRGFITDRPDVRLRYEAGDLPLIISVAADSDTTLVVNAPDGSFYCDDDGGVNGLNPQVRFNRPMSGRYEIWIGTYSAGNSQPARLHISEVSSQ